MQKVRFLKLSSSINSEDGELIFKCSNRFDIKHSKTFKDRSPFRRISITQKRHLDGACKIVPQDQMVRPSARPQSICFSQFEIKSAGPERIRLFHAEWHTEIQQLNDCTLNGCTLKGSINERHSPEARRLTSACYFGSSAAKLSLRLRWPAIREGKVLCDC